MTSYALVVLGALLLGAALAGWLWFAMAMREE